MKSFNHKYDVAQAYLEKALAYINENHITPIPLNYALVYAHMTGEFPQLSKTLDELVKQRALTYLQSQSLFDEYLEEHAGTIFEELDSAIRSLISNMAKRIQEWSKRLDRSAEDMEYISEQLSGEKLDQESLQKITEDIRAQVQDVVRDSSSITEYVTRTTQEIQRLKSELNQAKMEAQKDPLTDVANRRAFDNYMDEIMEDADEKGSFSLIMLDIDHFKSFNDEYGHVVGDSVLRYLGANLKKLKRAEDVVARYGGEEFAIILPGADLEVAVKVAERLREAVKKRRLKRADTGQEIRRISISLGVATYHPRDTVASIIKRADDALYRSKNCGRDQVSTEDDIGTPCAKKS